MKLIIDIPDYDYIHIKEVYEKNDIVESTYSYIYHGTPLDSNDSDYAEAQAYFDGESIGWDEGREALIEEVKPEIDKAQEPYMTNTAYDEGVRFGLMLAYQIVDKYKAESEDEE